MSLLCEGRFCSTYRTDICRLNLELTDECSASSEIKLTIKTGCDKLSQGQGYLITRRGGGGGRCPKRGAQGPKMAPKIKAPNLRQ
jgi:hypothetical protein